MNNKNVFNSVPMNDGRDIMRVFDNFLSQTQGLVDDMAVLEGKTNETSKPEKNSHIKNPQERALINDIDKMFAPPKSNNEFGFNSMKPKPQPVKKTSNKATNSKTGTSSYKGTTTPYKGTTSTTGKKMTSYKK